MMGHLYLMELFFLIVMVVELVLNLLNFLEQYANNEQWDIVIIDEGHLSFKNYSKRQNKFRIAH